MDQLVAFDTLKTIITSIPILAFLNTTAFFHIEADSSNYATEIVLFQE